jgi:hypothetical protein
MLKASVRKDLREDDWLIAVEVDRDKYEWATFTDRPTQAVCQHEDVCGEEDDSYLYRVLLEDGRVVIADSIDLEFEGAN